MGRNARRRQETKEIAMNMIDAINSAKEAYCGLHDGDVEQYEAAVALGTSPDLENFWLERMIRDALMVEALDNAIKSIESHGLMDKAALWRYKEIELLQGKVKELEAKLELSQGIC